MAVDYYALMTKAVAGKDAAARDQIYKDAFGLITKSHLAREAASSHAAALEDAIRRIEDDIAAEEANAAAHVNEVLSPEKNWKPFVVGACALVAAIALSAALYAYVTTSGPAVVASNVTTPSPKPQRGREDVVVADLKPGVDGGSTGEGLPFALQRQVVFYRTTVVPGSIVVDRENRFLYLIDANNSARRYGIGIARECLKGGSFFRVANKLEWPDWQPSATNTRDTEALQAAAGRPGSFLGARALLLDKPGLLNSRHQFAKNHRPSRHFRMHPAGQRRRRGFVPARFRGDAGGVCELTRGLLRINRFDLGGVRRLHARAGFFGGGQGSDRRQLRPVRQARLFHLKDQQLGDRNRGNQRHDRHQLISGAVFVEPVHDQKPIRLEQSKRSPLIATESRVAPWASSTVVSVALVNNDLVARLAAFFPDHDRLVARLALPDDGGAALVARALPDGHAGANRPNTDADTGFFCSRNGGAEHNPGRGKNESCFHRSIPQ